ncbi:hypothetical protein BH23GEM9_BH23GEM9_33740 [soil metagenome]
MRPRPGTIRALAISLAVSAAGAADAAAQGVRGNATTTVRYIEMRPITQDTVAEDLVTVLPDGSFEYQGIPVSCVTGLACFFFRSTDVQHAVLATQDVGFTAWGLGVEGLSVTGMLRGRADLGGDLTWPRSDDAFDAILAYAELNRGDVRARLGRQRTMSRLGLTGFDGASVMYDGFGSVEFEAYGGRSLMRGLNEPREQALRGVQEFAMDTLVTLLIGATARYEPVAGTAIGVRYQREIFSNRVALVSERASAEFSTSQFRPLMFDAAVDYDFAFGRIGKAHVTARAPQWRGLVVEATGRRHLPYFELNTIWGFFSPVGYHEAEARATWRRSPQLSAWASAALRRYEEADATVIIRAIEQQGTRFAVGGSWRATPALAVDASYRMDRGFGAFVSSGDASAHWQLTPAIGVSLDGTAFQQIEQFRVGEGIVYGGGASADVRILPAAWLSGGATMYRQNFENRPGIANWNQVRAWTALRTSFGRDPGAARRGVR